MAALPVPPAPTEPPNPAITEPPAPDDISPAVPPAAKSPTYPAPRDEAARCCRDQAGYGVPKTKAGLQTSTARAPLPPRPQQQAALPPVAQPATGQTAYVVQLTGYLLSCLSGTTQFPECEQTYAPEALCLKAREPIPTAWFPDCLPITLIGKNTSYTLPSTFRKELHDRHPDNIGEPALQRGIGHESSRILPCPYLPGCAPLLAGHQDKREIQPDNSASKSEFTTSPIDDSLATFSRDPVTADYTAPPAFQTKSHHLHPDNIDAPEKNELDPDCTDGVCNVFGKNPAVRASIGGGLIWDSPFGPLRLDVAWPVEGPR